MSNIAVRRTAVIQSAPKNTARFFMFDIWFFLLKMLLINISVSSAASLKSVNTIIKPYTK